MEKVFRSQRDDWLKNRVFITIFYSNGIMPLGVKAW